ncbi:MAG: hypothetical protein EBQ94_13715 [Flavobacteriales bacterium]|nr:hypothetical protein [Flavobacteriales bacterium]
MKKVILKNLLHQSMMEKDGVLKVDLLDQKTLDEVYRIFCAFFPNYENEIKNTYYFSIFHNSKEELMQMHLQSVEILKEKLDLILVDYKILGVVFQVKGVGPDSFVNIHQDLTVIDESKYSALTCWFSLSDSNQQNGAIHFLKGSHNLFRGFRAHTLSDYQFSEVEAYIIKNSEIQSTKIGEVLFFDPATIHFSKPNVANQPRISLSLSIVHKDAEPHIGFYDQNKNEQIELYKVPDDFWYIYDDFSSERLIRPIFGKYVKSIYNNFNEKFNYSKFVIDYEKYRSIKD